MLVGTMTVHNYSGQDTQLEYHPRISINFFFFKGPLSTVPVYDDDDDYYYTDFCLKWAFKIQ